MRILEVVPEWPPHVIGGGGSVYREIALWLAREHQVTVACGDYTNRKLFSSCVRTTDGPLELLRVPLVPTPVATSWLRTALPPVWPAYAQFLALLREEWDVGHLHGMCIPMIDAAAAGLRRRSVPYVLTLHGVPASPLRRGFLIRNAYLSYARTISARTVSGAACLTAVSRALLSDPLVPKRDARVIYNGLTEADYAALSDHHGVSNPARLVSLGRLSANKGIDTAIEAVSLLSARGIEVRYDIYGPDGGEQLSFARLASKLGLNDRVRFLGSFSVEQRSLIFAAADVILVPSRVEGFGIVALEALAAGVPVVASRVDGLAEYLSDDAAVLVPPADPPVLAAGIVRALQLPQRQSLIERGRALAKAFHWDRILGQYEQVLATAARKTD